MANGRCPRCGAITKLTKHHILPKRFYKNQRNAPIVKLCRACHDKIELRIPQNKKLEDEDYFQIVDDFLPD